MVPSIEEDPILFRGTGYFCYKENHLTWFNHQNATDAPHSGSYGTVKGLGFRA